MEFIIRKAANREPYCIKECIELANSLIDKSVTQEELVEWKKKQFGKNFREENAGRVGYKWWTNFVKRNKTHLSVGRAVCFDMKRNEWCNLDNFNEMYTCIYKKLVDKGIAEDMGE